MRRSDLPYLDDLRAFEAVARLGSVRAAAQEMSLTHAAISRRVKRLSETVQAPLFQKAGRGLLLTEAGVQLHDTTRRCFDDLGRTVTEIRKHNVSANGAVLLSCERSVAMRWLIPRLSQFQDANPEVVVHLSVGGGSLDAGSVRPTLALRRLDFAVTNDWSVTPLFKETVGPVMAPAMLPRFLNGDYVALGSKTRPDAWDAWLAANPDISRPESRRMFDHHFLSVEASSSGLGVAMSPHILAADDIGRGRLIAPMGFDADGSEYGVLAPADAELAPGSKALLQWLVDLTRQPQDSAAI
ncbi:MAG: LysR family transcriptional regulator [Pseudomonadota bacterium]